MTSGGDPLPSSQPSPSSSLTSSPAPAAPATAPAAQGFHRVALVSPSWPPGSLPNGIVTYVANIRAGLAALGVTSAIIASEVAGAAAGGDGSGDDRDAGADKNDVVDARDFRPSFRLRAVWKARERLARISTSDQRLGHAAAAALARSYARERLDLFEMEESFGAARFAQGAVPCPMVVRLHGPWCLVSPALGRPDDEASFRRRVGAEKQAIVGADGISSPSRFALEQLRAYYNLPLPHAAVVPNAIAAQPEARRWRLDGCDRSTVLFVGRFDRLKGGDVVLAAFADLARDVPAARLVFVGPDRGFRDPSGRTWSFTEYARAHLPGEVVARIQMMGEQPPAVIADLRRRSFVTMLASRFETFSMTAVEALSHGSPLVAPAAAAIMEIVDHGRNGLLFADADAADAARQLRKLFQDPALAQRLGAAGAEDSARRFAPEVVARQMVSFYADVRARWQADQR